jgi:hypothetical protein
MHDNKCPTEIVVRASEEAQVTLANFSAGTSAWRAKWSGKNRARADEMEAQRGARPTLAPKTFYRRPEERKRETGSATGCRRNTQRATAKPNAA